MGTIGGDNKVLWLGGAGTIEVIPKFFGLVVWELLEVIPKFFGLVV